VRGRIEMELLLLVALVAQVLPVAVLPVVQVEAVLQQMWTKVVDKMAQMAQMNIPVDCDQVASRYPAT
jgi:hypothetical protein